MAPRKIVLMACGSYSPPTFMHLRMFEIARDYLSSAGLGDVIGGIISPVHDAYGKKDLVESCHRIEMCKLALKSSTWVKVSEWETQQSGWTRTRLTLNHHEETINKHFQNLTSQAAPPWLPDDILNTNGFDEPDNLMEKLNGNSCDPQEVNVRLLCGGDLLESFAVPGLWADEDIETIVGKHGLVVITRTGSDPGRFIHDSDILYKHRKNITLITNYITNEVSSTMIRRLLRRGESAKYLTDDGVIAYVKRHGLYGAKAYSEYKKPISITPDDITITPQDNTITQDDPLSSPEEYSYNNIFISIQDRPIIRDQKVTVKKARKLLNPTQTNTVTPTKELKPKIAYTDRYPATFSLPGRAVKIAKANSTVIADDKVCISDDSTSLLTDTIDLKNRRKSEGFVDGMITKENLIKDNLKKRCSASTVKKLSNEVKPSRSKSEMARLCEKVKNHVKKEDPKPYKTRSCNDIVRLVLTKHGIHVISDTEAIL